jgi:hypothetical protein
MSWRHNKLVRAAFDEQADYKRQPNKATYAQQKAFEKRMPTDEQFAEMARKEKKKGKWTRSRDMKEGSNTFGQMVSEFKGETVKDVEQRLRDRWDSRRRQLGVEIPGYKGKKKEFDQYGRDYREAQLNERFLKNVDKSRGLSQKAEADKQAGFRAAEVRPPAPAPPPPAPPIKDPIDLDAANRAAQAKMQLGTGRGMYRDSNLPRVWPSVTTPGVGARPRSTTAATTPAATTPAATTPAATTLTMPLTRREASGHGSYKRWKREEADARSQILNHIEGDPTRAIPAEYYAGYGRAIGKAQEDYLGKMDSEIIKLKVEASPVGHMGSTKRVDPSKRDALKKKISELQKKRAALVAQWAKEKEKALAGTDL